MNAATRSARRALRAFSRPRPLQAPPRGAAALVVAPHPDDETLGCGATIARWGREGVRVHVAVLTDGAASHASLMEPSALAEIRRAEFSRAVDALGVAPGDIHRLGFADGTLGGNVERVAERLGDVLRRAAPDDVFVPYAADVTPDHVATNAAARRALRGYEGRPRCLEYAVWFWHQWPWVGLRTLNRRDIPKQLWAAARSSAAFLSDFRWRVDMFDMMDVKRVALKCYASQLTRYQNCPGWPTLGDVAGGEFLDCFFEGRELFCQKRR